MRYPDLPTDKRLPAARLAGTISRITGRDRELPREAMLEQIRAVTEDQQILGHELGCRLGDDHPTAATALAVELLRELGADEAEAARVVDWHRARRARDEGGFQL